MAKVRKEKVDIEKLRVLTTTARASHPHVFKPTKIKETDKPRYSIELLFDKKTTDLSQFSGPVKWAIIERWGKDKTEWPKGLQLPYRDGDKPYGKKREVKPEHKGMWVVRASSQADFSQPHVIGRDKEPLTKESEFYPGCYCRAALKANAYSVGDNEGVQFILDGVQFVKDGEAFGGKPPAGQMFGAIEGDDGGEEAEELDALTDDFEDNEGEEADF